jgi:hypothetical protein
MTNSGRGLFKVAMTEFHVPTYDRTWILLNANSDRHVMSQPVRLITVNKRSTYINIWLIRKNRRVCSALYSPVLPRRRCTHVTTDVATLSLLSWYLPRNLPLQSLTVLCLCLALYKDPTWVQHMSPTTEQLLRR